MRRIGRDEQDALPALAGRQRERRRAGGLADAALAAEEHDLPVEQASGQQHGRLPIGECSMPMRRCQMVELLEQVRIDLEQIERGGIGQRGRFHEAEQQKQIVQLGGLLPQLLLVAAEGRAVHEVAEALAKVVPGHTTARPHPKRCRPTVRRLGPFRSGVASPPDDNPELERPAAEVVLAVSAFFQPA